MLPNDDSILKDQITIVIISEMLKNGINKVDYTYEVSHLKEGIGVSALSLTVNDDNTTFVSDRPAFLTGRCRELVQKYMADSAADGYGAINIYTNTSYAAISWQHRYESDIGNDCQRANFGYSQNIDLGVLGLMSIAKRSRVKP